jgi:hypothetical protein
MAAVLEVNFSEDVGKRGSAALALVQQLADTIAACESQFEQELQNALAQLTAAEDRNVTLARRAAQAEQTADEAENWLRRLHQKLQEEFASAKRNLAAT